MYTLSPTPHTSSVRAMFGTSDALFVCGASGSLVVYRFQELPREQQPDRDGEDQQADDKACEGESQESAGAKLTN